jgi:hypothetical protein
MEAIQGCCYSPCQPREPSPDAALRTDASVTAKLGGDGERSEPGAESAALSYKRSEKTSLLIKTRDGDVVRLRIGQRESAAVQGSVADDGEKQLTELGLRATSTVKLGVFIRGDLDADELAAIRSVVEQAGSLAQDFFAGETAGAFAAASDLQIDGQQLARVALSLRVREQFSYAQSGPALPLPGLVPPPTAGDSVEGGKGETALPAATMVEASSRFESRVRIAISVGADAIAAPATETAPATENAPAVEGAAVSPVISTEANAVVAPAESIPAVESGDAPEARAEDSLPAADPGNLFAVLGSVLGFLTRLIEAFEPVPAGNAAVDGTTEAGVADSAPQVGSDSVQFSLKMRIFSSVMASFSLASTTESADTSDDSTAAAVATLSDAVETIAAEADPALDAVA